MTEFDFGIMFKKYNIKKILHIDNNEAAAALGTKVLFCCT